MDYSDWRWLFWLALLLGSNKDFASCLPLTGLSHSVLSIDHGVLRGPICDIDSWLWFVLPRLDHPGCDLRCAMEVNVTTWGLSNRNCETLGSLIDTLLFFLFLSFISPKIYSLGTIHYSAQLLPIYNLLQHIDSGWTNTDPQCGKCRLNMWFSSVSLIDARETWEFISFIWLCVFATQQWLTKIYLII